MHFKENKEIITRNAIFALLIIFTAVIQNTKGLCLSVGGAVPMLLIPLTVSIAMFSNDVTGMLFGALSGVVWDYYSPHFSGFYAVLLTATGYACSYLIARYMRNSHITVLVYTVTSSFVCGTLYWLFFVVFVSRTGCTAIYFRTYVVSIILTTVLTPIYYSFVKMIAVKFRKEDKIPFEKEEELQQ